MDAGEAAGEVVRGIEDRGVGVGELEVLSLQGDVGARLAAVSAFVR